MSKEWPLWEVFIRSQHGLAHKHVGSLHAPDAEMAINNARDVYTRRNEGVGIWVVRASDIASSNQLGSFQFNSLADLEAGRSASFQRTLAPQARNATGCSRRDGRLSYDGGVRDVLCPA